MVVQLPGSDVLPPGPVRDLVTAVHELYRGAGMPGLRTIAQATVDGDYRDTVSHQKVAQILSGDGVPRWSKLDAVVRVLAERHTPRLDVEANVAAVLELWHRTQGTSVTREEPPHEQAGTVVEQPRGGDPMSWQTIRAMHPDRAAERLALMTPEKAAGILDEPYRYDWSPAKPHTKDLVSRMPRAAAVAVMMELSSYHRDKLLRTIDAGFAAAVLANVSAEDAITVLADMKASTATSIVAATPTSRAVELLAIMSPERARAALDSMVPGQLAESLGVDATLGATASDLRLAPALDRMPPKAAAAVVTRFDAPRAGAVLAAMTPATAGAVLRQLPEEEAIALLAVTRFRHAAAVAAATAAELRPHVRARQWWRR